ncbi:MAG: hypothetical protein AAGA83_18190 [Cyanobacteria bacterium P01_F01_bin.116]
MTTQEATSPSASSLYEQTKDLVENSKALSLSLHQNGQTQAQIQKEISKITLAFQTEIAADKALSNEAKRKAALSRRLDADEAYQEFELQLEALKNEAALMTIDLQYTRDLIKVNLAFAQQS